MPDKLPKLTDPEFEIMKVVWNRGKVTVNEVLEAVNSFKKRNLKRTTIQVQMKRLEDKGWLSHQEEDRNFLYRSTRDREEVSREITRDIKKRIFDGSYAELVRALFHESEISREEIGKIRRILDEYEEG
ncbi:MAG: BlaI/MecI/CopY family transcriptional regulator [Desulfobacteraceae bacterium]|nr:MAG: BlaI/MecI/CopY family transcriptional regulator [Desulfobacteraceae bacterium]